MTTLGDLIGSIASALHSYTGIQEPSTYLTSSMSNSTLTQAVADSSQVMRGIIEIDDELMYVDTSDANSITIAPFGRGYRGSTAAAHNQNAQVVVDPMFPRSEVRRAIDQIVLGLYPNLFQIKTADITYNATAVGYDLPADCANVLDVKYKFSGDPTNYWRPLSGWAFDPNSPATNGKSLNLFDFVPVGSTIRVVYQAAFGAFTTNDDTLASIGLKEDWADLIVYGVTSRMVRFLDPVRLQIAAVENATRSQFVATGDAGKVANQLYAMYQQRLTEERKKLLELTKPRMNFTE